MAVGEQLFEADELDARIGLGRPVPGDHLHAAAKRNARDFGGDAAEPDQAERLAGQLHRVFAEPVAGAHLAVHPWDDPRRGPHQCDRGLRDRGIAITLDQMHGDAEFRELFGIHVAARAGAEKYDMLQPTAFFRNFSRQRRVVDDADFCAAENGGPFLRSDVGIEVHAYVGIACLALPFKDLGE